MKDQANDTIQAMADYTVTEAQIENLVVAKGYTDCVAFIGDESVSLAVAAPEGGITEADTAPHRGHRHRGGRLHRQPDQDH